MEQLKYLANIVTCFVFCYLSFLTRSWYWLNEKLCGFLYCPWFNVMSLLSWNNWIGCNSIQQPWSNLSDSDAWAKAFYRLIESSMAGWCDSLVERQNLCEGNIQYVSSSALRRFISPKNIKQVSCILSLSASASCHFIISLSKPTSTGSLRAFPRFYRPPSLSLSVYSTHRLVFFCWAFTLLWLISTHTPNLRLSVFLFYLFSFYHVRICCWAPSFNNCRKSISLRCL